LTSVLYELAPDQQAIVDSVERILADHAGPARVRDLGGDHPSYDHELEKVLRDQGFLGFALGEGAGPLEAALVVEKVAAALGVVAAGSVALVAPGALADERPDGPIALAVVDHSSPVRFAADATALVVLSDDEATVVELGPGDADPVRSRFGYPIGVVHRASGRALGAGTAATLRSWWRLALALELCGTSRAAIDLTVAHVRDRFQFGRPLGAFQAIQHRLAECEVLVQGARFLALEAAWSWAEPELTSAALIQALRAADRVFWDTHQFSGALGFAVEYDLHLWTMRIPALRAEAMSNGHPSRALAAERWGA
jgi:alkylation response protein AidB-like acyl-CoA dehydrogenase